MSKENHSFCIPPLVRFYTFVLFYLLTDVILYLIDNTNVELIVLALGVIPLIMFYKMRCNNCNEKIGEFKGFDTILVTQKCYNCGHNLLKCEED